MALVLSYRLTMEVAAALTLFVDVHRRPRKANLPNLNIVGQGTTSGATSHTTNAGQTPVVPQEEVLRMGWEPDRYLHTS
jgi:hypothetical protein